jgi:hypothetical protein
VEKSLILEIEMNTGKIEVWNGKIDSVAAKVLSVLLLATCFGLCEKPSSGN